MKQLLKQFIAVCIIMLITLEQSMSQKNEYMYLQKETFTARMEELEMRYGRNKIIPAELETECLAALSFYPELKNTTIEFKFGEMASSSTMESRPKFSSIFRKREKRKYVIIINKKGASKLGLQWSELSFNALVGWIGHELGHILHYSNKSAGGILFMGLKYVATNYKRKMERFTDQLAIQHNLGLALFEGTDYTLNCSNAKESYKNKSKKKYLLPGEIIERIFAKDFYTVNFHKTEFNRHLLKQTVAKL